MWLFMSLAVSLRCKTNPGDRRPLEQRRGGCAALCAMRHTPHEGQIPRRLQLNATSSSLPQPVAWNAMQVSMKAIVCAPSSMHGHRVGVADAPAGQPDRSPG